MSRIGKKPIPLPPEVTIQVSDDMLVVRGPKGELRRQIPRGYRVARQGEKLAIEPISESAPAALWGTIRALVSNMVEGVTQGFEKKLEIEGIGYQARLEGQNLIIQAGFTHPIVLPSPPGISFKVERNIITVAGIDKERVGQVAAAIRALRKPEPYKGKGIRYQGEIIRRKAGKKAVTAA